MTATHPDAGARRRARGTHAGIDRARIAEAAQAIDPRRLTVQAVADQLGVDRKAIHHHVSDREGLLRLVAVTTFQTHFAAFAVDPAGDWRDAVGSWAAAVRDSVVATGLLADYFRLARGADDPVLISIDRLLRRLLDAGFTAETASRGLVFLASFAIAAGRDVVLDRLEGGHPQRPEVERALHQAPDDALPTLRQIGETTHVGYDQEQFDFSVRLFVRGMEHELRAS